MSEGYSKPPPQDGQLGTAHDGTPVAYSQAMDRWLPVSGGAKGVAAMAHPAAPKNDQKRVDDMLGSRDEARSFAGLVNDFAIRNDKTQTGGMLAVPGYSDLAQSRGWKGSDDLGIMDADSLQAATRMRAPGMRLTQMEFQKFLGGVPSTKKAVSANRPFQEKANIARVMADAQSSFYDTYIRTHGSLNGADQAWNGFYAKHFDPATGQYFHEGVPSQGASAAPSARDQANAKLKARSAQTRNAPVLLGIEPGT